MSDILRDYFRRLAQDAIDETDRQMMEDAIPLGQTCPAAISERFAEIWTRLYPTLTNPTDLTEVLRVDRATYDEIHQLVHEYCIATGREMGHIVTFYRHRLEVTQE